MRLEAAVISDINLVFVWSGKCFYRGKVWEFSKVISGNYDFVSVFLSAAKLPSQTFQENVYSSTSLILNQSL